MSDDAGDLILNTSVNLDGLDDGLDEVKKDAEKAGKDSGGLFGESLKTSILGATAIIATALAGLGVASFDIASEFNQATNDIQTQLGLTREEAQGFADDAADMYGGNFGDSVQDVTDALITTRQQMRGLYDEDIQGVAEKAIMVRDVFGIDIAESTNAANTLMQEFGLTSQEAMDFIVAGQQKGLNASGDFLDTIGEYAPQFKEAGATADEMFSLLETGLQGGVLGTDKVADSMKEFRLRMMGMSEDTAAALYTMGIDANEVLTGLETGTLSVSDAFTMVQDGLKGVDNEVWRNTAGVAVFGTQWEDAGESAILGIDLTATKMEDLSGATDGLNAKYNNLSSMFTGVWRMVQTEILLPIGNTLLELGNTLLPYVQSALETLGGVLSGGGGLSGIVERLGRLFMDAGPALSQGLQSILMMILQNVTTALPQWIQTIGQFGETLLGWIIEAAPKVLENLGTVWTNLAGWVTERAPVWGEMLLQLADLLWKWIVDVTPTVMAKLGEVWTALAGWVTASLPGWGEKLMELGGKLWQWIVDVTPTVMAKLGEVLGGLLKWVEDSLPGWGEKLMELGGKLWQWVIDILPTLGTKLGEVTATLLGWASDAIGAIVPELLRLAGKFLGWIVTDVLPALPGKLLEISGAILGFIGNFLIEVAPELLKIAGKFLNWIADDVLPLLPEKLGAIWTAISGWISGILDDVGSAAGDIGQALIDGIAAVVNGGIDLVVGAARTIINPIIGFLNDVIDGANAVSDVFGGEPIPPIPELASGTNFWKGGLAMASEPWLGPEWATVPGGGSGFLSPGIHDLPRGTEVLNARESAGIGAAQGGDRQPIHQYFDAGVTEEGVRTAAREAAEEALRSTATTGYLYQQTGGF